MWSCVPVVITKNECTFSTKIVSITNEMFCFYEVLENHDSKTKTTLLKFRCTCNTPSQEEKQRDVVTTLPALKE